MRALSPRFLNLCITLFISHVICDIDSEINSTVIVTIAKNQNGSVTDTENSIENITHNLGVTIGYEATKTHQGVAEVETKNILSINVTENEIGDLHKPEETRNLGTIENFTDSARYGMNEPYQDGPLTERNRNILSNESEMELSHLERQKKENIFKERDNKISYRARDDLFKKKVRSGSTEAGAKITGPRIERIIERYVITNGDLNATSDIEELSTSTLPITTEAVTEKNTESHSTSTPEFEVSTVITMKNFDRLVLNSNATWVVQFYSTNCLGCMVSLKSLVAAKKSLPGNVKLAAINVAVEVGFVKKFDLSQLPRTMVFYSARSKYPELKLNELRINNSEKFHPKKDKKILIFSSNLTIKSIPEPTDMPQLVMPDEKSLDGNDSQFRMKEIGPSTQQTRSNAQAKTMNEAIQIMIIYVIFKRIFKYIFVYIANAIANVRDVNNF